MAGTNRRAKTEGAAAAPRGAPVVVLVAPQLAENVGTAARAMLNCGLTELRLVKPRDPPTVAKAITASSGADAVLHAATVHATFAEAIGDCHRIFATTARNREMVKPVLTARHAAGEMRAAVGRGEKVALVFGPERTGLFNDDLALCDTLVSVPLNPAFASLNLAQAVLLVGYEWLMAADATPPEELPLGNTRPATREELLNFFLRLEAGLEEGGFFQAEDMRPHMTRNIRNAFERAHLTEQEIRTLHGIVFALRKAPPQPGRPRKADREAANPPTGPARGRKSGTSA